MKANKKTKNQRQDISKRKRTEEDPTKSEERFRAVFEAAQDSIFIKDRESRYVQVNPATERLFGLPASELIGKTDTEIFGEEAGAHIAEMDSRVLAGEVVEKEDTRLVRGSLYTFHVVKAPMRDSSGEIIGLCGIARDVTARKQAEEALRESRQKFDTMAENVPGILFRAIVHKDGSITLPYVSPSARKFGLYSSEEMSVQPELLQVVIHPDYHEQFKEMTATASGKLEPIDWEVRLNTQFTSIEFIRVIARPQATVDGDVVWDGLALDITARKRAEEALLESEETARAFLNASTDLALLLEIDGIIVTLNEVATRVFGKPMNELIGVNVRDLLPAGLFEQRLAHSDEVVHTGKPVRFEDEQHGTWRDHSIYPVFDTEGKVSHLAIFARDITEHKRAEELQRIQHDLAIDLSMTSDLAESMNRLLETIFRMESIDCGGVYLMNDRTGNLELVSYKGLSQRFVENVSHYRADSPRNRLVMKGEPLYGFYPEIFPDMSDIHKQESLRAFAAIPVKYEGKVIAVLNLASHTHDEISDDARNLLEGIAAQIGGAITRVRAEEGKAELEEQLRQAMKMEAIGRLAGGIAHDFNNMLAIIQGYADLLLKSMSEDDPNREDVESIRTASKRAAALTGQLLAFGRKQAIQPKVLNLNEIIAEADSMLQRIIGEDIELVTKPGKDLWRVKVDPSQIEEQVIINLTVNAREAMPSGGKLTIETTNVTLDEDYTHRHAEVTPGEYVILAVSDTGIGMSEEIMSHVFEPFFTTKTGGESSGLGLSTIYGIIKQSGGHIQVSSTPGKGSTFRIYLPRAAEPAELAAGGREPRHLPKGTETVLVAEDEPAMRDLLRRILREEGYTVLEASDGKEAARAAADEGEIHLLVTDIVMPHMSGKDLADRIKTVHPNIKVLFVSGYTDNTITHHDILHKGVNFLAKPFTSAQLVRTVRRILDTK